uniref:Uncharacterized protein n=1 Tax=viral metagenome TaxID=1070528 RepID=A0A6C0I3Y3_9ZZZZ
MLANNHNNNNNNPFFFIYLFYLWIVFKLWGQEHGKEEEKAEQISNVTTLQERTQEYIVSRQAAFLKHFEKSNEEMKQLSSNVDPEFYMQKSLQQVMQDPENHIEPAWRSRKLMESTPRGTIIMHYDAYKQGFSFYSDIQGVSYSLLNAVAMKYVILFQCLHFFVDDEVTPESNRSPLIEDVVVSATKTCMKIQKRGVGLEGQKEKEYSRNRFIHLGRLSNCSILQRPTKKNIMNNFSSNYTRDLSQETILQKQVMSYSDFKRKQKNHNNESKIV